MYSYNFLADIFRWIVLYILGLWQGANIGWETRSFVWAIWLSSLLVGYFFIVLSVLRYIIIAGPRVEGKDNLFNAIFFRIVSSIWGLVVTTLGFIFIHGIIALFIYVLFPLVSVESLGPSRHIPVFEAFSILSKEILIALFAILKAQWVLIIAYLMEQVRVFKNSRITLFPEVINHNTVRLHLLVLFLWMTQLTFAGKLGHSFFIYAIILFFYIFDPFILKKVFKIEIKK